MGALLALPVCARQQQAKNDGANAADDSASKTAPATETNNVVPYHNVFAVPAVPRSTPFPAAADSSDEAPGRLLPRYEIAGGYSYIDFSPGGGIDNFNNHGATGSFTYNANRWLGLTAELGEYTFKQPDTGIHGNWTTYMFGPRFNLRHFDYFVPFAEILVGGGSVGVGFTGDTRQNAFVGMAGAGVDVVITRHLAWRFAQLDFVRSNFSGPRLAPDNWENSFRIGTGVVYRWGLPNPPPPPAPKGPPVAACSASPSSVFVGANDAVAVHVNASSPDNLPLTYSYTATGGAVEGTGPDARWNPSGTAAGTYTVNAKVDDGKGGTATCAADISVQPKPHHPPTISCSANPSTIMPGERSTITSTGNSPDNLPLTYSYTASGGQVTGTGAEVQFDSTGAQPGSYKITCTATDPNGDKADSNANVDVQQPPPPPQATKIGDCGYRTAGSSRVDNVCKRVLDDAALRLKNEPNAKLVIVGFADAREPKAASLAAKRAELGKAYMGEKGIDASRVSTRTGEASKDKAAEKDNRRIEIVFVPDGATY
jgi:outer membrane protein OmpA-like peptidoglycan-associated protein